MERESRVASCWSLCLVTVMTLSLSVCNRIYVYLIGLLLVGNILGREDKSEA